MVALKFLVGALVFLAILAFSAFYLLSGFQGIAAYLGSGWAWGAAALAVLLRVTFPITLGAFYCAWQLWGWHWALAVLWAAPGLAVALPSMLAVMVSFVSSLVVRRAQ